MPANADFYIGRGIAAEWLGSYAFDGEPMRLHWSIRFAETEREFRASVVNEVYTRDDGKPAAQGWPWPWPDSNAAEWVYAFDRGLLWAASPPGRWFALRPGESDSSTLDRLHYDFTRLRLTFPDMSKYTACEPGRKTERNRPTLAYRLAAS